jgi:hypothetical protein
VPPPLCAGAGAPVPSAEPPPSPTCTAVEARTCGWSASSTPGPALSRWSRVAGPGQVSQLRGWCCPGRSRSARGWCPAVGLPASPTFDGPPAPATSPSARGATSGPTRECRCGPPTGRCSGRCAPSAVRRSLLARCPTRSGLLKSGPLTNAERTHRAGTRQGRDTPLTGASRLRTALATSGRKPTGVGDRARTGQLHSRWSPRRLSWSTSRGKS